MVQSKVMIPDGILTKEKLLEILDHLDIGYNVKILTVHGHVEKRCIIDAVEIDYKSGEILLHDGFIEEGQSRED